MHRYNVVLRSLLISLLALIAWGCSKANESAPMFDASGKHPASWYVNHRASARTDINQCKECHGADLSGGVSKLSCFSASVNGQGCHPHPADWANPDRHGADAKKAPGSSGFASCRACHGDTLTRSEERR